MGRRLRIEDLKDLDDGSFEKMKARAREAAGGDTDKALTILTEMVVREFVSSMTNKKAAANISKTDSDSWSHEEEKRKAKKQKTTDEEDATEAPPELPEQFKNRIREMNGTEAKLLIQKKVRKTDLEKHQRRFAIPRGELKITEFLTWEEHMIVDRQPQGKAIDVKLLDPVLEEFQVQLKRWKMGNSFTYNLTSGWPKFLEKNETEGILRLDDLVQIWCFQRDSKSCLAMVNLSRGAFEQVGSSQ